MEKITQLTEADVGRVAVDENSSYRVKILGLSEFEKDMARVEYLPGSKFENGRWVGRISNSFNLAINGGGRPMYWEDSSEQEPFEANTPFTLWCRDNGYDPKGEFIYDKSLSSEDEITFKMNEKIKIENDDASSCPLFKGEFSGVHYEYFSSGQSGVFLKQYVKGCAKPRFRKQRQKPPVRKKTDVTLEYVDGTLYHLKNVKFIDIKQETAQFNFEKIISNGIRENSFINIDLKLIKHISVVSPKGDLEIYLPEMWVINKDITAQFTSYSMSF